MPHIATAMHRSLRRGIGDIMAESLLGRRDIGGEVSSVKNTFSSWDNCMAQSYCKWPVIVAIIVVSLILLSIITCIVRCACCGYSCCCACFSFLKCCDCCGDSCAGKKDKPMKHLDDPAYSNSQRAQGYQAPAPMMGGALGGKPEPPQYAQFEVGKNGLAVDPKPTLNEDALPPMPSWQTASKKHVLEEDEKNGVELGELDPATGQRIPLMSGAARAITPTPSQDRAQSPFGARPAPGPNPNSYMNVANGDPYAQNQSAFAPPGRALTGSPSPDGYRGNGRGYGGPGGQGRGYPQDRNGQGRGLSPNPPQDPYATHDQYAAHDQYGAHDQYAAHNQYPEDDGFVGTAIGGYGQPNQDYQYSNNGRPYPPQHSYSNDSSRPLNPGRQYSDRSGPGYPTDNFQPNGPPRGPNRGPNRMASPPLQNNSGFDFGGGDQYNSRPSPPPQQNSYGPSNPPRRASPPQQFDDSYYAGSTAPPTYASRSPPPQESSYPGYRQYQPNHGGRGGPGSTGGREPQRWDPVQ